MSNFNPLQNLIDNKFIKTSLLVFGMSQLPSEPMAQAQEVAAASIDNTPGMVEKKPGGLFPKYPPGRSTLARIDSTTPGSSPSSDTPIPLETLKVPRASTTPVSPQVEKFLRENPEAEKFFQVSLAGEPPRMVGAAEYQLATELKDRLNLAMNELLTLHEANVSSNSPVFQKYLKESNEAIRQLCKLTGDTPTTVAHTSFSSDYNRKEWAKESIRLERTLEQAAFRAQSAHLKLVWREDWAQARLKELDKKAAEKRKVVVYDAIITDGDIPKMLARAITSERTDLLLHMRGYANEIPLSPNLRRFLEENPAMAHHFVVPRGSRGVDFVGKTEYKEAERALDEYERITTFMLSFHENKVSPSRSQLNRISGLSAKIADLTGVRPVPIFRTSSDEQKRRDYREDSRYYRQGSRSSNDGGGYEAFQRAYKEPLNPLPTSDLRQVFLEDMMHLRSVLELAAFRPQEKHLYFVEKFELTEADSWKKGIMLNEKLHAALERAIIEAAREGRSHPIVEQFEEERQERTEVAQEKAAAEKRELQRAHNRKLQDAYEIDSSTGANERKLLPPQVYDRIGRDRAFKGLNVDPKKYNRSRY